MKRDTSVRRPVDRVPHDTQPEKPRPHVATQSAATPLLVRVARFAAPELERQLKYAKIEMDDARRGARHTPEAYRRLVARYTELDGLHHEVKGLLAPNPDTNRPDPAVISVVAQTVTWAIQRCTIENLSAAVSARMESYLRLPPTETQKVLKAIATLEQLWKGARRG